MAQVVRRLSGPMPSLLYACAQDGSPLKSGKAKHTEEPGGFYTGQDTGNSPFRCVEWEPTRALCLGQAYWGCLDERAGWVY